ncbi:MAG TPA: hypothetical protein VM658_14540 [bacterium]|nr:hypothetical protein [bacterium]
MQSATSSSGVRPAERPSAPVLGARAVVGAGAMARIFRGIIEAATGITPEIRARFADESLCRRCGRCCLSGVRVKDRMIMIPDLPCRYLRSEPGGKTSCAVYQSRGLTAWCQKVCVESIRKDLFGPDCPYVQGLPHYHGKIEISEDEFDEITPILRNVFKLVDKPDYVRHSDWDRFVHQVLELPR